ncbi:MAG: pyrroline-5-carboxylate reductase [Candidatus Omnitrophica bacterium]|nr:pyrroline-5-carboxylate reductase [Candidatus Omnitrophota bacterium]
MSKKMTVGIIGGGNMGTAIAAGIWNAYDVYVCEKDKKREALLRRKYSVKTVDIASLVKNCKVLVLAVKPQNIDEVLDLMNGRVGQDKILISVVAGITSAFLEKRLGGKVRVIRAMPNLPAQIREGITGISKGQHAKPHDLKVGALILGNIGQTVVVDEKLINAITAVSGSGPAYVFLFLENLVNSAVALGLSKDMSMKLSMQTIKGSISLIEKTKQCPSLLREQVTSKGGTTQAALDVFAEHRFDKIFCSAVKAAEKRAKELARN